MKIRYILTILIFFAAFTEKVASATEKQTPPEAETCICGVDEDGECIPCEE